MRNYASFAIGAVVLLAPVAASSHFFLEEPTNLWVQNNLGNPQKLAPCGGTSDDPGTPTNAITEARGGDMLHIKIRETVFHPGHYRVALAVNSIAELPPDPETTTRASPRGPLSVSAKIDPNPKPPVLADGLFVHTERPSPGSFHEADILGYRNTINDNVVLVLMIETLEGLKNADEIAKVPEVHAIFAASSDLGNFAGYKQGDPDYERECMTPPSRDGHGGTGSISPASRPATKWLPSREA
jgi:hypothetical protein